MNPKEFDNLINAVFNNMDRDTSVTRFFDRVEEFTKPQKPRSSFSDVVDDPNSARSESPVSKIDARTTESRQLFVCPACRAPVTGRVAVELQRDEEQPDLTNIRYIGKPIGVQVSHDCTPRVTRS